MSASLRFVCRTYSTLINDGCHKGSSRVKTSSSEESVSQENAEITSWNEENFRSKLKEIANYGGITDEMRRRASEVYFIPKGGDDPPGY